MTSLSWPHLTHLHRGIKNQRWAWPGLREILFNDLERIHKKSGHWDLVLFTGDLTQKGSSEEFKEVDEIFEQLWRHFRKLGFDPKLLAVSGNHDLVRPDPDDPFVLLFEDWEQKRIVRDTFWENPESPYREAIQHSFDNYTDWWSKQPYKAENVNPGMLPGDFAVTIEKDRSEFGIIGLNSAFLQLSDKNYQGKLALHAAQFHDAVVDDDGPEWAKNHNACLFMTHHPPKWLNPESVQQLNGEITSHGRFAIHICG
ncbi:metallophosphoesterase [Desulfococcaceae bacterium HSG9]|nr:metallophosphoesterase [Desulfococcaceae bacterium HSG9]